MGYLTKLVELFVVASILQNTAGLKCRKCTHVTITNIPTLVKSVIDTALKSFLDVNCSQELTGPTQEIKEETCEARTGKEARCSWFTGTLTMKIPVLGTELPFLINKRGCYYAEDAAVSANGCNDLDNINQGKNVVFDIIEALSQTLNLHGFQGKRCFSTETETYGDVSSAVSYFYKLPLNFVIGNVLVMFVLKYV